MTLILDKEILYIIGKQYEPRHERICLRNFRSGPIQTGLYIY